MKTIVKNTEIIPGIPYIYAIPINFITLINGLSVQFSEPVDQIMYAFQKATDSDSLSIRSVQTDAGTHFDCSIRFFVPGLSLENISLFKELAMFRHMVIFQSYGGEYWRVGNKSLGLKFSYQHATSPRIGYEVTFSGNLLEPPKLISPGSIF